MVYVQQSYHTLYYLVTLCGTNFIHHILYMFHCTVNGNCLLHFSYPYKRTVMEHHINKQLSS